MGWLARRLAVTRGLAFVLAAVLVGSAGDAVLAQSRAAPRAALRLSAAAANWAIAGTWVYRSYLDRPDVMVGNDAQTALSLLFGEGTMTLRTTPGRVSGTFDMGGGYVLDLSGTVTTVNGRTFVHMKGPGRAGTPTAGWEYDYDGVLTERWPTGVNQIPAIVGTVLRAKPHGACCPAGVTASFISVKKP